jgi:hypothetical protein
MGGSCSLGAARGGCSRILLGHLPAGALYRPQSPSGDAFPHATPSVKEQGTPRKADMMLPIDRAVVNRPEGDQEGHVPDMRGLEKDLGRRQARRKEDYRTALTALRSSASPKMPSFSSPRPGADRSSPVPARVQVSNCSPEKPLPARNVPRLQSGGFASEHELRGENPSSIADVDAPVASVEGRATPWLTLLAWAWGVGIVLSASSRLCRIVRFLWLLAVANPDRAM